MKAPKPISHRSKVEIETISGWRRLIIDGKLQFDERDEYLYHQPLARIPCLLGTMKSKGPARALVIGGGDMCAVRELINLHRLTRIDVIEFNPTVLRAANLHLREINQGAGKHQSVKVWERDALDLIDGTLAYDLFQDDATKFSVVVLDLTYPDSEAVGTFFTVRFFEALSDMVEPHVGVALNSVGPEWSPRSIGGIMASLAAARFHSILYTTGIPSTYEHGSGRWGFVFAARRPLTPMMIRDLWKKHPQRSDITAEEIERGFRIPIAWNNLYTTQLPFKTGAEVLKSLVKDENESLLAWRGDWTPSITNGPRT